MNSLHIFLAEIVATSKHPLVFSICNLLREGSRITITPQKYWIKNYTEKSIFKGKENITQKEQIKSYLLGVVCKVFWTFYWIYLPCELCMFSSALGRCKTFYFTNGIHDLLMFPRYCFKSKTEQFHIYQGLFYSLSRWLSKNIVVKGRFLNVFSHWSLLHVTAGRFCILVH